MMLRHLRIGLLLICGVMSACQSTPEQYVATQSALRTTGQLLIDDLLHRDELMWYRSEHFTGFHYAEAVAVFGALQVAEKLGDQARLHALQQKYRHIPDYDQLASYHHVDGSVVGIVPLQLFQTLHDDSLKQQGLWLADAQWEKPLANGMTSQSRYWIDDIYMINAIQMQAYRLTREEKYLNRAALNTLRYLEKIQQPNGLFWHGPEAPFFWGRGNGWVAAGVAELLRELPPSHPDYSGIVSRYQKMMQTLLTTQSDSGLWRQLVDYPDSWQESSATAMFAWAMLIGVQQGILDESTYLPIVTKAWQGLQSNIQPDGKLNDICVGTGQSKDVDYYLSRPKITGDLHGQAPMLWLIASLLEQPTQ